MVKSHNIRYIQLCKIQVSVYKLDSNLYEKFTSLRMSFIRFCTGRTNRGSRKDWGLGKMQRNIIFLCL
jgi:hypothetical protein